MRSPQPLLRSYYDALFAAHGPQHWWPGRTRFEIIVGAILTQNTSWTNVARAVGNLRRANLLTPRAIESVSQTRLARLIRSSGYFRQKAKKLKAFVHFLNSEYSGSRTRMFHSPTATLRAQLLSVHGIGPETADSILLYAGNHPVFVIDAYTRRILERHGLAHPKATYDEIRALFESSLPPSLRMYNEFHALIVRTGKDHCRPRAPRCDACPLKIFLPSAEPLPAQPALPEARPQSAPLQFASLRALQTAATPPAPRALASSSGPGTIAAASPPQNVLAPSAARSPAAPCAPQEITIPGTAKGVAAP